MEKEREFQRKAGTKKKRFVVERRQAEGMCVHQVEKSINVAHFSSPVSIAKLRAYHFGAFPPLIL